VRDEFQGNVGGLFVRALKFPSISRDRVADFYRVHDRAALFVKTTFDIEERSNARGIKIVGPKTGALATPRS
jgi:hypothetical protein